MSGGWRYVEKVVFKRDTSRITSVSRIDREAQFAIQRMYLNWYYVLNTMSNDFLSSIKIPITISLSIAKHNTI